MGIMIKITLAIGFAVLLLAMPQAYAEENVYRCRAESGGIIFQQQPCSDAQVVGNGLQHEAWRKLRSLTAEGFDIMSRLGADVESIKACKAEFSAYRLKLDAMRAQMTSLVVTYPHLAKAYGYLYECAVCKTSAEAFCRSANQSLDEAMKSLIEY